MAAVIEYNIVCRLMYSYDTIQRKLVRTYE